VRIGINQNENYDTAGPEDNEVAGPGGANLTGGDVTRPQDAGRASDEATQTRLDSKKMEQRQQQGKVGHQRKVAQQREEFQPEADGEGYQTKAADDMESSPDADESKKKADVTSELSDTKTQLLHLAADFENYKRASLRREEEIRERATRRVLEELLPVLDNFERAVAAAETTTDVNSLKIGVEYILQQFQEAIKNNGAEPIEAEGKPFDPAKHDAIEEVESDAEQGTVVEDVQRGYLFKGQVIRPSRVKVAK
jgi:molecular chaperone GrpE